MHSPSPEDHYLDALARWVAEGGQDSKPPPAAPGVYACDKCGAEFSESRLRCAHQYACKKARLSAP